MKKTALYTSALFALLMVFSSCQKCVTCIPYTIDRHGNVVDDSHKAQAIKVCDKLDINAYEHGTHFQDQQQDSVFYVCK